MKERRKLLLQGNTKQAQRFIDNYINSTAVNIFDIYKRPSKEKIEIAQDLIKEFNEDCRIFTHVKEYRFIRGNSSTFSFAYIIKDNPTDAEFMPDCLYFMVYITKNTEYCITLSKKEYEDLREYKSLDAYYTMEDIKNYMNSKK